MGLMNKQNTHGIAYSFCFVLFKVSFFCKQMNIQAV